MGRRAVLCVVLLTAFIASGCAGQTGENPDRINSSETGQNNTGENLTGYVYSFPANTTESTADATRSVASERLDQAGINAQVSTEERNGTKRLLIYTENRNQTRIKELMRLQEFKAVFNYTTKGEGLQIEEKHSVTVKENSVTVSGKEIRINETAEIESTAVKLERIESGKAHLLVKAYGSESIENVLESQLRIRGSTGDYRYSFPIVISTEAASRVQGLSQNFQTVEDGGNRYLGHENGDKARLYYFVDEKVMSALSVSSVFKKQLVKQPSITGSAETKEKASSKASDLIATIKSGQMPVNLNFLEAKAG